ncbi:MAG TPA: hypothetical protein VKH61_15950, partial [Streptosporangiaceae bacterium]|nr:hypothetical protein [Streptosporangiaceae bacterium]
MANQDPGADRVHGSRRAQHVVTGRHRHPVGLGQHGLDVLAARPPGQFVRADVPAEPEVHGGIRLRLQHDPAFGLAVRPAQVLRREAPVGMHVDRQPLPRVKQLDQQPGIAAVPRYMLGTEPRHRVRGHRLGQQRPVRQPRHPVGLAAEPGRDR